VRLAIPVILPLNSAPERDDDLAQWLAAAAALSSTKPLQELAAPDAMMAAIMERVGPLSSQIVNTPATVTAGAD
jgi:hypothetical protein